MSYLLLRNLRVSEANILNSGLLVGGAPVMPAMLFAHAIGRALGGNEALGVAYVHHDIAPKGERVFGVHHPQQRRSASYVFESGKSKDYASSAKGPTLSLQPVATGDLQVSLLIEFARSVDAPEEVSRFLGHGRLAGGRIDFFSQPQPMQDAEEGLAEIRTGFIVLDRHHLIPKPSDGDPLKALVSRLGQEPSKGDGSWLSATHVGYAPITPAVPRGGAREGYIHAYAEPLIGLIQFHSIRQFDAPAEQAFWRPYWTPEGVFVLKQPH
jgi:CRISPR-associated protein Csy2